MEGVLIVGGGARTTSEHCPDTLEQGTEPTDPAMNWRFGRRRDFNSRNMVKMCILVFPDVISASLCTHISSKSELIHSKSHSGVSPEDLVLAVCSVSYSRFPESFTSLPCLLTIANQPKQYGSGYPRPVGSELQSLSQDSTTSVNT